MALMNQLKGKSAATMTLDRPRGSPLYAQWGKGGRANSLVQVPE